MTFILVSQSSFKQSILYILVIQAQVHCIHAVESARVLPFSNRFSISQEYTHKKYEKLIEGKPCTKYGIDQVKGSKDIDRTRFGLQTDRQLQNNMPPFSRGA